MDKDELGVGDVPQEHPHRPAADVGVGQEGLIHLLGGEAEDAGVEVGDAAAVAAEHLADRECSDVLGGAGGDKELLSSGLAPAAAAAGAAATAGFGLGRRHSPHPKRLRSQTCFAPATFAVGHGNVLSRERFLNVTW